MKLHPIARRTAKVVAIILWFVCGTILGTDLMLKIFPNEKQTLLDGFAMCIVITIIILVTYLIGKSIYNYIVHGKF